MRSTPRRSMSLMLAIVAAVCMALPAAAQRGEPRVIVQATIAAEPASQTSLAIQVGPASSLPSNSFIRLRGLPSSVSLTEGHLIAPGAWAIPLFALASLKAIVPAGVSGRADLTLQLVSIDGAILAEAQTALVVQAAAVAPPEPPAKRAIPPVAAVPPPAAKAPPLTDDARQRAERLVTTGERHFEQGNLAAARMFFQRAAEAGLASGAIKMGATYDPAELSRLDIAVVGATANLAEARRWYERARELGAPEADDRLGRIGRR
jgi:hypothetical protein